MATSEEIGRRIRRAREEIGITQGELGRRWGKGKSHAAISDIERGTTRVTASGLAELAKILGKTPAYFYGEEQASAQFFRGGRDEGGAIIDESSVKDFKDFLRRRQSERNGQ